MLPSPHAAPLRVLHLGHGRIFGGIETLLVNVARAGASRPDMRHEFAVCYPGRLADELRATGSRVHLLGAIRTSRPLSVWRARARLRGVLAAGAFDAVVSHAAWPHAVLAPVARGVGVPLVYWQHDAHTGTHWIERWAARCAPAAAICNSRFTAQTLGRVFPDVPGEVVYCPIAPAATAAAGESRAAVRREFNTPADAVVLVQVSRMQAWKGQLDLLEALAAMHGALAPGGADWACWFVGGAQRPDEVAYERLLRDRCEALGLSARVTFCGQRADVPRVLAAADVFCQPNAGPEPFGIVFVEALYAGLPAVATALGGATEIVDAQCGRLVPPGDRAALAAALRDLVTSPPLRRTLGSAGPARARALCDPPARLDQLHAVLSSARSRGCAGALPAPRLTNARVSARA